LLVEVCRICTEWAGYRMAWVGLAEQDEAKTIRPAAQAGFEEGYLEQIRVTWADSEHGRGPVGTAVRTASPCVIRDTGADPRFAPWRDEALRRGYASCAGLPLMHEGRTLGALAVYAPEKDAFDETELGVLQELADSLAYGIMALRTREALRRAHDALEEQVRDQTRELAASHERYRALVESSQDAIFQLDRDARLLFVNTAGARPLGLEPATLIGKTLAELFPQEAAEQLVPEVRKVFDSGVPLTSERSIHVAGTLVTYSTVLAPVFGADARVESVVGIARDVTRRNLAEAALRRSEARYAQLLESLPNFVLVVDSESVIQYANHPVPGVSIEQLVGSLGFGHLVPEHQEQCRRALGAALATGQVQQLEVLDRYGLWWSCQVVSLSELEGRPLAMVICADVTARHAAEEALRRKEQSLRQLLEVYERHRQLMAYEIHDGVTQPLAGALMTLEGTVPLLQENCANVTRQGFSRVADLLREGIAQSRRLMGGLRPPVLDESGLPAALDYLAHEVRKDSGIEVALALEMEAGRLAAPLETAVFRIVQEGLANVGRHSRSPSARVAVLQKGDRLRIEVEDQGVGFDPEAVDPARFGLQGIRERARLLGGEATIQSAPGRGTRIAVDLPVVKAAAADDE
jgi:PAS domain S-box-containing protein